MSLNNYYFVVDAEQNDNIVKYCKTIFGTDISRYSINLNHVNENFIVTPYEDFSTAYCSIVRFFYNIDATMFALKWGEYILKTVQTKDSYISDELFDTLCKVED